MRHPIAAGGVCLTDFTVSVSACSPTTCASSTEAGSTDTSLWTHYQNGAREYCGNSFPDGMAKNQRLAANVITPTTKSETHDVPISPAEIVAQVRALAVWLGMRLWQAAGICFALQSYSSACSRAGSSVSCWLL
jgi:hypothetical protein